MEKVNKKDYSIKCYNNGYYGIIHNETFECVYGGDSANDDDYNEELITEVFKNWNGTLKDGRIAEPFESSEFSIIRFFDPYGDGKSERKQSTRMNFRSGKPLKEVERIIEAYNNTKSYYQQVKIAKFDKRKLKSISDFEKSEFCKERV